MTGMSRSSAGLDERRRRLLYRAWHRGIREMDLIMGRFAEACIEQLSEDELDQFERLMQVPDRDLYTWINGEQPVPAEYDIALFRRLRGFDASGPR